MESQSLILGIVIAVLCLLFVGWPFFSFSRKHDQEQADNGSQLDALIAQREAIYSAIRDLDFDYETGKVTEDDYRTQRALWVERGVDVLKAIDTFQQQTGEALPVSGLEGAAASAAESESLQDLDAQIEAAIASRRRSA